MASEYRLRKGMNVLIFSADKTKDLGVGKYVGEKQITLLGRKVFVPKFKLKNKIIYGYECWWMPKCVADSIRRQNEKDKEGS